MKICLHITEADASDGWMLIVVAWVDSTLVSAYSILWRSVGDGGPSTIQVLGVGDSQPTSARLTAYAPSVLDASGTSRTSRGGICSLPAQRNEAVELVRCFSNILPR